MLATKSYRFGTTRGVLDGVPLGTQGVIQDVHDVRIILGDQNMEGRWHEAR